MRYLNAMTAVLQVVLLGVLLYFVVGYNKKLEVMNSRLEEMSKPPLPQKVHLEKDPQAPFLGSESAKVEMIIFSDFECTFCRSFAKNTLPRIKQEFVDKGLVKIYYRDLPLEMHTNAIAAAEAGACANDQGKFWPMHDAFFAHEGPLNDAIIRSTAGKAGLDMKTFSTCISNRKYKAAVESDMKEATTHGITGTPTIVINGTVVIGDQPYEQFRDVINAALSLTEK